MNFELNQLYDMINNYIEIYEKIGNDILRSKKVNKKFDRDLSKICKDKEKIIIINNNIQTIGTYSKNYNKILYSGNYYTPTSFATKILGYQPSGWQVCKIERDGKLLSLFDVREKLYL